MAEWTVWLGSEVVHKPVTTERNVTAATLSVGLDSAGQLEVDVPVTHPLYSTVASLPLLGSATWRVERDGSEVFRGRTLSRERRPVDGCVSVVVEGDLAMLNDTIVEPYEFGGTPRAYLEKLVGEHNAQADPWKQFTVGTVTAYDSNGYIVRGNESRSTTWEELGNKTFDSSTGGHIVLRRGTHVIDWLVTVSETCDQPVRLGWNLLDMEDVADGAELVTAIRAVGADVNGTRVELASTRLGSGVTLSDGVLANDALVATNGTVVREVVWDDVTTEAALWNKAYAYVKALALPRSVTVSAIDMTDADVSVDSFDVGQMVTLDALDTTGVMQVTSIEWDLLDPANGEITFGNARVTSSARSAQTSSTASTALYVAGNSSGGSTQVDNGVKTAGDSWTMSGYRAGGFITSSKKEAFFTIATPFRFEDYSAVTVSGTYTVRQNDMYLFGSSGSSPASLDSYATATAYANGYINVTIATGAAQSSATNNDSCAIVFNSLTITLT